MQPHKVMASTPFDLQKALAAQRPWWEPLDFSPDGIIGFWEGLVDQDGWVGLFAVAQAEDITAVENVETALEGHGFTLYRVESLHRASAMEIAPTPLWRSIKEQTVNWSSKVQGRDECFLGLHFAPGSASMAFDAKGRRCFMLTATLAVLRPTAVAAVKDGDG